MTALSQNATFIADRTGGRDNHFNLLRMIAASGVLVSHAFPISFGPGAAEPLARWLNGINLGNLSVMAFFAISGFFIARSFDRRRSIASFFSARILRLFPALIVMLAVTVAVGFFLTVLSAADYWHAAQNYYVNNLSLFGIQYDLADLFGGNKFPVAVNGSLWTLQYEVLCYMGVVLIGLAGGLRKIPIFVTCLALFFALYFASYAMTLDYRIEKLMRVGLPFATGTSLYVWRDKIPLSAWIIAAGVLVTVLLYTTPIFPPALTITVSYAVVYMGFYQFKPLLKYNALGDYSYGIYIYAFPIQQFLSSRGVDTPAMSILTAFPVTLAIAVLSWHIIERPALGLKDWPNWQGKNRVVV